MKLRQALQGCSSAQLARIVAAWRLTVEAGTLRRELVELIADWLTGEATHEHFWDGFSPTAGQILQSLTRAGGRHDADLLLRRFTAKLQGNARETEQKRLQAEIAGLIERGIVYRIFEAAQQRQGVSLVLPDELRATVPAGDAEVSASGAPPLTEQPAESVTCDPAGDLFILASALRREAWSGPSRGLAGRAPRTVGQIVARLRAGTPPGPGQPGQRWRFLLWLAQRGGWMDRAPLPAPDDDAMLRLFREPSALPGRALAAGPAQAPATASPTGVTGAVRPGRLQSDALQLLSELPAGDWWTVDALAGWVAAQLVDDENSPRVDRQRAQVQRTVDRWLGGRWFWLGLVAWGRQHGSWRVVRPTEALRSVVRGVSHEESPPERHPCEIGQGPGLTLLAPEAADLAVLYRAEPYLSYTGSSDGLRTYQLTPPSLERGIRLGGAADDLLVLLTQLLGAPPPDTWSRAINRWSLPDQPLRLDAGLILSADDAGTLAEALAVPGAEDAVSEQLSPTHVRIAGDRLPSLLAELAASGLPVKIDEGVRAEPAHPARASALAGGAAEAAWIGLEIARRLAPEIVDGQRDLAAARQQLEAIFSQSRLEALERRVASIMATSADRKRPKPRRRVV